MQECEHTFPRESQVRQRQAQPTCAQAACTLPSAWEGMNTCKWVGRKASSSGHQVELGCNACCKPLHGHRAAYHLFRQRTQTGVHAAAKWCAAFSQQGNPTRSSSFLYTLTGMKAMAN